MNEVTRRIGVVLLIGLGACVIAGGFALTVALAIEAANSILMRDDYKDAIGFGLSSLLPISISIVIVRYVAKGYRKSS